MDQNQAEADKYQLDFDQMSQKWMTNENEFMGTNKFSSIKSNYGPDNHKNLFEESKYDSFFHQFANLQNDSVHLRDQL